jgi:hypothetical protein
LFSTELSAAFSSRLFVVYDKAKEYLSKISSGIDQQVDLWQHRRRIILDQMNSASSFDFLMPKTQRINELTIEAVQGSLERKYEFLCLNQYLFSIV